MNKKFEVFAEIDLGKLERSDLGVKGFVEILPRISELKSIIDELIQICEKSNTIPPKLVEQLVKHVDQMLSFVQQIMDYSIDEDSSFRRRQSIINQFSDWHNLILSGVGPNNNYNNFLTIFNAIKSFDRVDLAVEEKTLTELKSDLLKAKSDQENLLLELKQKVSEEVVSEYAIIFQKQADSHSKFVFTIKNWKLDIKFGNAQWWLLLSFFLVLSFGLSVFILYKHFNIDVTNSNNSVIVLQLITRLVILSFVLYLVSFSIKQYNVQKHLYTLNKHRQNTLNSYKLFLTTIDKGDVTLRSALMMEVAKAIYDAGQTGYLSIKGGQDNAPSIIELNRFINKP